MNPPPMEKKVRSSRTAPTASKAVNRRPLGCWICAPGGNMMERWKIRSRFSSNGIDVQAGKINALRFANRRDRGAMAAGSMVAGSLPARPSSTARSVACPMPVRRQRAVQVRLHALATFVQDSVFGKPASELARRPHRTHRMRTRWPNADFVEIEETGRHASDCRPVDSEQSLPQFQFWRPAVLLTAVHSSQTTVHCLLLHSQQLPGYAFQGPQRSRLRHRRQSDRRRGRLQRRGFE